MNGGGLSSLDVPPTGPNGPRLNATAFHKELARQVQDYSRDLKDPKNAAMTIWSSATKLARTSSGWRTNAWKQILREYLSHDHGI